MALKGRKQSAEHIARRMVSMRLHKVWPHGGPPRYTPETLWARVAKGAPDECWPWMGYKNSQGYGRVWLGNVGFFSHRVIFDLANPGVIELKAPKDRNVSGFLRHSCDNPCCCNPAHLIVGTHAENMKDKIERGRMPDYRGERGPRAKLTAADVRSIRELSHNGATRKYLAEKYGVSIQTIKGVRSGRHYSDVK